MSNQAKDTVRTIELDIINHYTSDKNEKTVHDPLLKQFKDTTDSDQNVKSVQSALPVDTGWSWVILFGVAFELMIIVGLFKSSGIIFVAIQERFGSSASITSLISTLSTVSWSITSLLVMNLGSKFLSNRTITVVGILTSCICYIIASVAQDFALLLLSNGILQGAGAACIEPIGLAMLGNYFEKHRGLACSISSSGGSLGGLVFAPLLTAMLEYYGFSGTMLLVAAFVFQCLVTAMLFRPQSFYLHTGKKRRRKRQAGPETNTDVCLNEGNVVTADEDVGGISINQYCEQVATSPTDSHTDISNLSQPISDDEVEYDASLKDRAQFYSHVDVVEKREHIKTVNTGFSSDDSTTRLQASMKDRMKNADNAVPHKGSTLNIENKRHCFKNILALFEMPLFKDPVFIVLFSAGSFMCVPCALCMVYLAPHAKDENLKPAEIAKILSIYSAIDLCSRLVIGFISDRKWIRRSTKIAISGCIVCVVSQSMSFYKTFPWLLFYAVIFGMVGGCYFAIFTAVILDYFPLPKLNSIIGFIILAEAIF